jgi:glutathione S-transferase
MLGAQFSAADVLWGTALGWTIGFGLVPETPSLVDYAERVGARPASVRVRARDADLAAGFGSAG